jgi:hypothetical protein
MVATLIFSQRGERIEGRLPRATDFLEEGPEGAVEAPSKEAQR